MEQSRHVSVDGTQVGVGPPWQSASLAQGVGTPPLDVDVNPLLDVDPPPSPVSRHWRRSRHASGAKRHPGAPAVSPSAMAPARKAPCRALGWIIPRW
jgi:hypothetical protein